MTQLCIDPSIEITVTNGLRHLLAHSGYVRRSGRNTRHPKVDTPRPAPIPGNHAWRAISLRRDGTRPIRFQGARLLKLVGDVETPLGTARQRLALFIARDQGLFASLVVHPPNGASGRPTYDAAAISDPAAMLVFLRAYQPRRCFHPVASKGAAHASGYDQALLEMEMAFTAMIKTHLLPCDMQ